MTADDAPLPRTLRGRYALGRRLGGGGQGTTFEGVDEAEGRPVAIKEFAIRGAESWKDVELAEREATVLAKLDHPLLPKYIDHFEEEGRLYLVMEMIEGIPVSRGGSQGVDHVYRFLEDAAGVLDYLHGRTPPVIHRDIKPSNVIEMPDGRHAIVDFGAVRSELKPEGGSTVVGTFGYMAPEQFQGRALPATDVYAVGATALWMLTGKNPEDLPHRGLGIDVRGALAGTAVPGALTQALERMLAPDPDIRPSKLGPLVRSLRQARSNGPRRRILTDDVRLGDDRSTTGEPPPDDSGSAVHLPPGPAVFFRLAITIARVAVALALGALVPVLLTLLSVVLGPGLRRAARSVQRAGRRADASLASAAHLVRVDRSPRRRHRRRSRRRARARVDSSGAPKQRIATDTEEFEDLDSSADDVWDSSVERRTRR